MFDLILTVKFKLNEVVGKTAIYAAPIYDDTPMEQNRKLINKDFAERGAA